jgi:hypothetical protein
MKGNNIFIFLMVCICINILSCKFYATQKYHLGKRFNHKDKVLYLKYIVDKNVFEKDKILYLDSSHYVDFIVNKIQHDSSVFYLGCYLNDSTILTFSNFLKSNISCSGRIKNEIEATLLLKDDYKKSVSAGKNLSQFQLKLLSTNNVFDLNKSDKKLKLFFTYSYKFGTYYDSFFKEIKALTEKYKTADMYLVCIDLME